MTVRFILQKTLPYVSRLTMLAICCFVATFPAVAQGQKPFGDEAPAEVRPVPAAEQTPLAGTQKLDLEGDISEQLVAGVDKFLLRELDQSIAQRPKYWQRDFSAAEAYEKSVQPNRERLAHILGVRDARTKSTRDEILRGRQPVAVVESAAGKVAMYEVRWPVLRDVFGEGLLLVPQGMAGKLPAAIVIPDADQSPEQICGLVAGTSAEKQFALGLAQAGNQVLVPTLVGRQLARRSPLNQGGGANMTDREFAYRPAFELGRHVIGYEVQKVLAAADWLSGDQPLQLLGTGEGGMLALYAATLDTRFTQTYVRGHFASRQEIWKQPLDRNVFGLLEQFGDAELATLVAPRKLVIDSQDFPQVTLPSEGGAPAELATPNAESISAEIDRAKKLLAGSSFQDFISTANCATLFGAKAVTTTAAAPGELGLKDRIAARQQRQLAEIIRDTQQVLTESPYVRANFMKKLYDSPNLAAYNQTVEEYREIFAKQVIGQFDQPLLAAAPRTRKAYETDLWIGYEVVLDVFPDVMAYGVLCVPKNIPAGERRPVVVCQHGLEGRPQDTLGPLNAQYYSGFAGRLAEQGFITFAPQNLYLGKDKFRTLQRKANPLGKTLFSVIVPQHQQICNWLGTLPFVDADRIAFYGLSYGGKSAMRIPPLVKNYCLSICSADFNEWVYKNASTRAPYSYVWTGEYEIFEFDLGSNFNYSEMAALIAPRPFMVERGHFDGVSIDEVVAYEFAKVRHNYEARLKLPGLTEMELFVGPHKINGLGTVQFLQRHLHWPAK